MTYPKRLIEVDLPIKRISAHARREKSIRHGHISTLHIWWARRPLGQGWAGEKFALHKLRFHPDFVAPFSPPCEGGVRGGGPGTTSHKVFPCSLPLSPFASFSRGEKNRFRFPRLPHHPPYPPFAREGKGSLATSFHPAQQNTRLEIVPPTLSTPTFHLPSP